MPDLIAQGAAGEDRWRRELPDAVSGREIVVGRDDADWNVPWDTMISRAHVVLSPTSDGHLRVRRLSSARNPVFYRGNQRDDFTLVPGEHFVIGSTTFTLANRPGASDSSADQVTEHAYDHAALRRRHFRDAASRIETLSRLPDLIASSVSDEELLVRVTSVLLQATPSASAVAITSVTPVTPASQFTSPDAPPKRATAGSLDSTESDWADGDQDQKVTILHYDSRTVGREGPPVSARLVRSALAKRESILHLWSSHRGDDSAYTASEDVDWAFCVPLRSEACPGWALYVTGKLAAESHMDIGKSMQAAPDDLQDDVKFAELVGTTIANLRQSRRLERRQAAMRHFFAPVVMEALAGRDTDEVLAPREADLSVMFCDLRGFSRRSERDAENLLELLERVSDALGVMTRHILHTGGVIGDFHGDAAMGFWGWPLEQSDTAKRAAQAALAILADNRTTQASPQTVGGKHAGNASITPHGSQAHPSTAFGFGIGIATGRAVAGRIGTADQVKVTAFGPVVNLASRLEGLTKAFGAKIIIDAATADAIRHLRQSEFRLRRLARVRPAGLEREVDVYELLPSASADETTLSDEQIQQYESSLDALISGDWETALAGLHALPPWDRPKDVLLATILQHNRCPPENWTGTIELPKL